MQREFPAVDRDGNWGFFMVFGRSIEAELQPLRGGVDATNHPASGRLLTKQRPRFQCPAKMPWNSGDGFFGKDRKTESKMRLKPLAFEIETRVIEISEDLVEILLEEEGKEEIIV
jgi:hypothetical protein